MFLEENLINFFGENSTLHQKSKTICLTYVMMAGKVAKGRKKKSIGA